MNTKTAAIPKFISDIVASKLFGIISFTLLTVIAAQITIPVKPVPFTLQTVMVVLAGAFLGAKNGAYSQLLYLLLGCLGFPVFAHIPAAFGFMRLFGPTGGYLLSFPIAAFITGYLLEYNKSYINVTLTMFIANLYILIMGTLFLYAFYIKNLIEAITYGASVFSIWTVVKIFLSINIFYAINKPGKSDAPVEMNAPKVLEDLVRQAAQAGASDVHLHRIGSQAQVTFRLDGVMTRAQELSADLAERVFGRIKFLAKLKTYQESLPQDGRIEKAELGTRHDIRVATYPTVTGEKIVLRLFQSSTAPDLNELNLSQETVAELQRFLRQTSGLLLLTGRREAERQPLFMPA